MVLKALPLIVRLMVRSPSLKSCLGLALNEGKQAIGEKLGLRGPGGIRWMHGTQRIANTCMGVLSLLAVAGLLVVHRIHALA